MSEPPDLQLPSPRPPGGHDDNLFRVGTYVYWALSYVNDRVALASILSPNNNLVRTWSRSGARYTQKVENQKAFIALAKSSLTDSQAVEFTIDELLAVPIMQSSSESRLPIPDLKYPMLNEPLSRTYPVGDSLSGYRFWALSFVNNQVALAILAYDPDTKLLGRVTKNGTRYIASIITVQGNDIGQSDRVVAYTANELHNLLTMPNPLAPVITTADSGAQPTAPDGLKYSHVSDEQYLRPTSESYPVLRYAGLTYWGLSYVNQDNALCILGYDADLNLVNRLSKVGTRYLSRIDLEDSSVRFIGQSNRSVSFTLQELAVL